MAITIRNVTTQDVESLKSVLDTIELFPSEMLEPMILPYFDDPNSEEIWFTAIENTTPVAIGYCAPEKLTEGTFNLLAIGVLKNQQGNGIGKLMMEYIEKHISNEDGRILIVETSGSDNMYMTRKFYEQLDYTKEAVIRDFWADGDDKVVYWKKL